MCRLSPASPPILLQEGCFAGNGEQEPARFAFGFTKPFANPLHLSSPDPPITIPPRKARKEPGMRYRGMLQATTPQSSPGGACGASTVAESRACSARGALRSLLPTGSGSSGATEPSPAKPSPASSPGVGLTLLRQALPELGITPGCSLALACPAEPSEEASERGK